MNNYIVFRICRNEAQIFTVNAQNEERALELCAGDSIGYIGSFSMGNIYGNGNIAIKVNQEDFQMYGMFEPMILFSKIKEVIQNNA